MSSSSVLGVIRFVRRSAGHPPRSVEFYGFNNLGAPLMRTPCDEVDHAERPLRRGESSGRKMGAHK